MHDGFIHTGAVELQRALYEKLGRMKVVGVYTLRVEPKFGVDQQSYTRGWNPDYALQRGAPEDTRGAGRAQIEGAFDLKTTPRPIDTNDVALGRLEGNQRGGRFGAAWADAKNKAGGGEEKMRFGGLVLVYKRGLDTLHTVEARLEIEAAGP